MDQPLPSAPPVFTQAPAEPEPPKKSFPKWLIVLICLLFFVTIIFLFCPRPRLVQVACSQAGQLQTPCKAGKQIVWENSPLVSQFFLKQDKGSLSTAGPMHGVIITSPSPNPTADWKTYTNKLYAYSAKYPSSWWLYEPTDTPTTVGFWIEKSEGESSGVWVVIEGNPGKLSAKDWWDTETKKSSLDYTSWINGTNRKSMQIAGYDAFFVQTTKDWISRPSTDVYISKDERIYHIFTNFTSEDKLSIFDQILSTFKFTPNEPVKCTQNIDPCDQSSCNYDPAKCNP